jgi:hypothetical protein
VRRIIQRKFGRQAGWTKHRSRNQRCGSLHKGGDWFGPRCWNPTVVRHSRGQRLVQPKPGFQARQSEHRHRRQGGGRLYKGGDRFGRRPGYPTIDLRRTLDWPADGNRDILVGGLRCIDGERPFRNRPYAVQAGVCMPGDQGSNQIALLKRHLDEESRDASGGWLGFGDVVQCLA